MVWLHDGEKFDVVGLFSRVVLATSTCRVMARAGQGTAEPVRRVADILMAAVAG